MSEDQRDGSPQWMLERLAKWCNQWALDRVLSEESPGNTVSDAAVFRTSPVLRGVSQAQAGEIVLLEPIAQPDARPLYVAALPYKEDQLLCVPFSPFTEPATPGEMRTHFEADALRVLCFWAARVFEALAAPTGWRLDVIDDTTAWQWLAVYRAIRCNGRPPDGLRQRCGVPLSHPADPRREYLRMMQDLVDRYLGAAEQDAVLQYPPRGSDYLKAAEEPDRPSPTDF